MSQPDIDIENQVICLIEKILYVIQLLHIIAILFRTITMLLAYIIMWLVQNNLLPLILESLGAYSSKV